MAGLDQRHFKRLVDHRTQAMDVHAQRIGVGQFLTPHPGFQLLAGHHGRGRFHKRLQDLQCSRVELQQLALATHFQRIQVVFQIAGFQHAGGAVQATHSACGLQRVASIQLAGGNRGDVLADRQLAHAWRSGCRVQIRPFSP
ncbi:hypothetical protein G6F59_015644 [Rhizopus arrhizus]|nr:hypothetical protein G6F59_015644 [Rhizopus arrhizus]